ncbi:MAG TPA: guanylate cyclase, partial [Cytophagales bacterium]|nr:guanylate cyclase [Cytophagales bacterium]
FAKMGDTKNALECIGKIEQRQHEEPGVVLDVDLAMIWSALGESDKAFYYLSQCLEKRITSVAILLDHPAFKIPNEDDRYKTLKEKLNLGEYISI